MDVTKYLTTRTPVVWCHSDEPARLVDKLATAGSGREVYRMDAIDGLMVFDVQRDRWTTVLIDTTDMAGQPIRTPTNDMGLAFEYVFKNRGVFVIEHAHKTIDGMLPLVSSLVYRYRTAYWGDDFDSMPAQLYFVSTEPTPPMEIARVASVVTHELPTADELGDLITHIDASSGRGPSNHELLVRAGLGLSEQEFITASVETLKAHGKLLAEPVNDFKVELLRNNGVLDIREPSIMIDDLGGLDRLKKLIERIRWAWNNPKQARELGVKPLNKLLMVGVSGSGKSLSCEALAGALDLELAKGGVSSVMSKWVGESEQRMRRTFATLKRMAPIVFWTDEFGRDMSGGASSAEVDGGTTDRVHGEFLTGIQELSDDVFFVAAANRINGLAPELLRADRFDLIMFVGFPTFDERKQIFKIHLGQRAAYYDLGELARATPLFTGAEIKQLIKEVTFDIATDRHRHPTTEDITAAAPYLRGRMWTNHTDEIIDMYTRALKEWDWASTAQRNEASFVVQSYDDNGRIHPALIDGSGDASYQPTQQPAKKQPPMKMWS